MRKLVFIISGEKKTGKTLFLQKLIPILSEKNFALRGFYAYNDEMTDSYYIINIRTQEKILLMTRISQPDKRPMHFQINEQAIPIGTEWMEQIEKSGKSVLVLDEIGYFELHGMVWHNAFSNQLHLPEPLIFTTKSKNLPQILKRWNIQPEAVFYPDDFSDPENAAKQIIRALEYHSITLKTESLKQ